LRLEKVKYAEQKFKDYQQYIKDVLEEKIPTSVYIKQACLRHKRDLERDDLIFKKEAVLKVFRFFSFLNISDQDYNIIQFQLQPFQAFIIANLFGFYWKENNIRRFRYCYLTMGRGNGKSSLMGAIALYEYITQKVFPQVLFLATTRKQADILLNICKEFITYTPQLKKVLEPLQYSIRSKISANAKIEALHGKAERLDGLNPTLSILDEFAVHPNSDLENVIKSATVKRKESLTIYITTAGFNHIKSPAFEKEEMLKKVLDPDLKQNDDSIYGLIFSLDQNDDPDLEECWLKSNPNLGITITLQALRIEHLQAKLSPSQMRNFQTKNLNMWVKDSDKSWIAISDVEKCCTGFDYEKLKGKQMFLGLDLSSSRDLSSLTGLVYVEEEDKFYCNSWFWHPNNPDRMIRKSGVDYGLWIDQGYIQATETKVIDENEIVQFIAQLSRDFDVMGCGFDRAYTSIIKNNLESVEVEAVPVPQTCYSLNIPYRTIEKLIYEEKIVFQPNPVILYNFLSARIYTDSTGSIKVSKNNSLDSVDFCVSLAMALSQFLAYHNDTNASMIESYLK